MKTLYIYKDLTTLNYYAITGNSMFDCIKQANKTCNSNNREFYTIVHYFTDDQLKEVINIIDNIVTIS